jgi:hypothetical protein
LPVPQFAVACPPVVPEAIAWQSDPIAVAELFLPVAVALALPLGKSDSASAVAPSDAFEVEWLNMNVSADACPPFEACAVAFPPVIASTWQNVPSERLLVVNPSVETQVILSPAIAARGAIATRVTAVTINACLNSVFFKRLVYSLPHSPLGYRFHSFFNASRYIEWL